MMFFVLRDNWRDNISLFLSHGVNVVHGSLNVGHFRYGQQIWQKTPVKKLRSGRQHPLLPATTVPPLSIFTSLLFNYFSAQMQCKLNLLLIIQTIYLTFHLLSFICTKCNRISEILSEDFLRHLMCFCQLICDNSVESFQAISQ